MSFMDFLCSCTEDCYIVDEKQRDFSEDQSSPSRMVSGQERAWLMDKEIPAGNKLRRRKVSHTKHDGSKDSVLTEIIIRTGLTPPASPDAERILSVETPPSPEVVPYYPQLEEDSDFIESPPTETAFTTWVPTSPLKEPSSPPAKKEAGPSLSDKVNIEPCPFKPSHIRYKTLLGILRLETSIESERAKNLIWWFKDEVKDLPEWESDNYFYLSSKDLSLCLKFNVFKTVDEWSSVIPLVHPFDWIEFSLKNDHSLSAIGLTTKTCHRVLLEVMQSYPEKVILSIAKQHNDDEYKEQAKLLAEICVDAPDLFERFGVPS